MHKKAQGLMEGTLGKLVLALVALGIMILIIWLYIVPKLNVHGLTG